MARGPRISPEQQTQIVELWLEGATKEETAREMGINASTVQRYRDLHREQWAAESKESIEALRQRRERVHLERARRAKKKAEAEVVYKDKDGNEVFAVMDARGQAALIAEETKAQLAIDRLYGLDKLTIEATVDVREHASKLVQYVNRAIEIAELDADQAGRLRAGLRQAVEEDQAS